MAVIIGKVEETEGKFKVVLRKNDEVLYEFDVDSYKEGEERLTDISKSVLEHFKEAGQKVVFTDEESKSNLSI